jgi:PAS domain S-box-containing protein
MQSDSYKAGLNAPTRVFIYAAIALLLGNLSALVDAYHHPEIPYLDIEHQLVGGVIILVVGILMTLFERYLHTLAKSSRVIDAEREAAAALQEALISSSIDAFVRIDAQGRVLAWSTAAEKMFGWKAAEVLGQPLTASIIPHRHHAAHTQGMANPQDHKLSRVIGKVVEITACRADGTELPVELMVSAVCLNQEWNYVAFIRDISQRKATEAQLLQSQKLEAVGQLTGGLAHDFNNLLGVVMGNLELLRGRFRDDSYEIQRISAALDATKRGANLTKSLLAVARNQHLMPEVIDLRSRFAELLPLLRTTAGSGISVMDISEPSDNEDSGTQLAIRVDVSGLDSAIFNLTANARDALQGRGEITLSARLWQAGSQQQGSGPAPNLAAGDYVLITVADNGPGMSAEICARAFDAFFTTKERGRGTGLGLAMVHGFCRQSGGDAQIVSELGVGTCVHLWLPRLTEAETHTTVTDTAPNIPQGSAHVLVVDDEPELLELTKILLEQLGYRVTACGTGEAALQALANQNIDLLVTDIIMPKMDGVELAARACAQQPGLGLLYVSGFAQPMSPNTARVQAELLEKPFTSAALAEAVKRALNARPQTA